MTKLTETKLTGIPFIGKSFTGSQTSIAPKHVLRFFFLGTALLIPSYSEALTFTLPEKGNIVGYPMEVAVESGESLSSIGRQFDIGGYEMKEANPGVSYSNPQPGTMVTIPSQFILPSGARKGIVINLAEMRLYFYHTNGAQVSTYPIGIGQDGWLTPLGTTQIVRMRTNPTWVVPDSILENHQAHGQPIASVWPPGPDNPLGPYAMNLGFKNIVIHGSPFPNGVGMRSSHGCIRMLNEDVEELYGQVSTGTKVAIVHEPLKVGIVEDKLFVESHVPLEEAIYHNAENTAPLKVKFEKALKNTGFYSYTVRWDEIEEQQDRASGLPEMVGSIQFN